MTFFMVTERPQAWKALLRGLEERGHQVTLVPGMSRCLELLHTEPPTLAILDLGLDGKELRDAVISMLMVDASVHTAVVTSMPAEVFHDRMEGLGILLSLPEEDSAESAAALLDALHGLGCD